MRRTPSKSGNARASSELPVVDETTVSVDYQTWKLAEAFTPRPSAPEGSVHTLTGFADKVESAADAVTFGSSVLDMDFVRDLIRLRAQTPIIPPELADQGLELPLRAIAYELSDVADAIGLRIKNRARTDATESVRRLHEAADKLRHAVKRIETQVPADALCTALATLGDQEITLDEEHRVREFADGAERTRMPAKEAKNRSTSKVEALDPMQILYWRYGIIGPPAEGAIARALLPLAQGFIEAIRQHTRRTDHGYKVVDIADAIALSDAWERIAPPFAHALVHIHAAYSTQDEKQSAAYHSQIGQGGIPPRILGAVNKVNAALVRSAQRHNEEAARPGRHDCYRLGDVISKDQLEDLMTAKRALSALASSAAPQVKKGKRNRGRPSEYDVEVDARIAAAWKDRVCSSLADLADRLGWSVPDIQKALDRERARQKPGKSPGR